MERKTAKNEPINVCACFYILHFVSWMHLTLSFIFAVTCKKCRLQGCSEEGIEGGAAPPTFRKLHYSEQLQAYSESSNQGFRQNNSERKYLSGSD